MATPAQKIATQKRSPTQNSAEDDSIAALIGVTFKNDNEPTALARNDEHNAAPASTTMTLLQAFSPFAAVESNIAWWRGASKLRNIALRALLGEKATLREIRPVIVETAAATLQPYKVRARALSNLLNNRSRK